MHPKKRTFSLGAKSSQHQLLIQHNGKSGIVLGTTLKGPVLETPTLMLNDGAGNEINPFGIAFLVRTGTTLAALTSGWISWWARKPTASATGTTAEVVP